MPKLSIIVPVYKVEPYLEQCIDSILTQTYRDFECILIDDGSPDRCGEIIDRYASLDMRVRVIHQSNCGVSAARNAGLTAMSKEPGYVGFVDPDDYIAPEMFERLINSLEQNQSDISCCRWFNVFPETITETTFCVPEYMEQKVFFQHILDIPATVLGVVWNKIFRREIIKNRFPVGVEVGEDTLFLVEYCKDIKKASFIDEPLYYIRVREGSASRGEVGKMTIGLDMWKRVLEISEHFGKYAVSMAQRKYVDTCFLRFMELKDDPKNIYYDSARKHFFDYVRNNWKRILMNPTIYWKTRILYVVTFLNDRLREKGKTAATMAKRFRYDCREYSFQVAFGRIIRDLPIQPWNKRYNYYMRSVQQYIGKKYYAKLIKLLKEYDPKERGAGADTIWVMWWQGEEAMPEIVKMCYEQLLRVRNGHTVVLITKDNWNDYIDLPQYILDKVENGSITLTHLSDIIRWALLYHYGGFYLDIKFYVTKVPENAFADDFYSLRAPGIWPENFFTGDWVCGCLALTHSHDKLAWCMIQLFLDYWSKHNGLVDYFLCEFFQKMIVVEDSDTRKMIESVPENWNFMNLRAHLNDPYSPEELQEIVSSSDLHLLTYKEKFMKYTEDGEKTIYRHLLETGNPSEIT